MHNNQQGKAAVAGKEETQMQYDRQADRPPYSELAQTDPNQTRALVPESHVRVRCRLFQGALLGLAGVAVLAAGLVAVSTLNPLLPSLPKGSKRVTASLVYYVQHKQWKADLRTFVAAMEFVALPAGLPGAMPPTNPPVAYAPAYTTSPNS